MVDFRLLHLPQKLASVSRERFDVAALPLRINGVQRQGTLARTARTAAHRHAFARKSNRNVLQVVLLSALHKYRAECRVLSVASCRFLPGLSFSAFTRYSVLRTQYAQ